MYHNIFDSDRYEALSCKDNIFAQFLLEKGLYDTMEITEEPPAAPTGRTNPGGSQ